MSPLSLSSSTLLQYPADIEEDKSPECQETVEKIKQIVGEPRNYGTATSYLCLDFDMPEIHCGFAGPTPEERVAMEQAAREERVSV